MTEPGVVLLELLSAFSIALSCVVNSISWPPLILSIEVIALSFSQDVCQHLLIPSVLAFNALLEGKTAGIEPIVQGWLQIWAPIFTWSALMLSIATSRRRGWQMLLQQPTQDLILWSISCFGSFLLTSSILIARIDIFFIVKSLNSKIISNQIDDLVVFRIMHPHSHFLLHYFNLLLQVFIDLTNIRILTSVSAVALLNICELLGRVFKQPAQLSRVSAFGPVMTAQLCRVLLKLKEFDLLPLQLCINILF